MKNIFDFILALILLILFFIPLIFIAFFVRLDSKGSIFYKSQRAGKNKKTFFMYKFRTMHSGTPEVDTNSLVEPNKYTTGFGRILRKYSIDEFPQLLNVIIGEMSLVGPRPALLSQTDLIQERNNLNLNSLKPGITGLAQINGRDKLSIKEKIEFDKTYKDNQSFIFDLKILLKTISVAWTGKDIKHWKKELQ